MKHIAAWYVHMFSNRKILFFFLLSGLLLLVKESIHWVSQYSWGTSCCIYFTQSKAIPISSLRFGLHLDLILHQGPFRLWGDLEKTLWAWTWNVWSSLSSVSFELIITQEDLCWEMGSSSSTLSQDYHITKVFQFRRCWRRFYKSIQNPWN